MSATFNPEKDLSSAEQNANLGQSNVFDRAEAEPEEILSKTVPNPLESYASVNFLWTMACLTTAQFNDPSSYRDGRLLSNIVFSSAGRFDDARVQTFEGTPEFFIENFRMRTVIAPNPKVGTTNAVRVDFEVYEPYSMGLFLQSLQNAAIQAGYTNYLGAPMILRLDFKGFNDQGAALEPGSDSPFVKPKFFVIRLISAKFTVDGSGSRYEVVAIPYNHDAYNDFLSTVYNDITIRAEDNTVDSLLNSGSDSLAAALNKIEQQMVEQGKIRVPDFYKIEFPPSPSSRESADQSGDDSDQAAADVGADPGREAGTSDPVLFEPNQEVNPIGRSRFDFNAATAGTHRFLPEAESLNSDGLLERETVTINPDTREFKFTQGQSVISMIEQCIMDSLYVIDPLKVGDRIYYYRIDVQVEFLDFDELIGDFAQKIIFRVVPYLVNQAALFPSRQTSPDYSDTLRTVVKGYNYIYSGQNVDVLKFDIEINNLFFVGMNPTPEVNNATENNPDLSGTVEGDRSSATTGQGNAPEAQTPILGRKRFAKDLDLLNPSSGGSGTTSPQQQIAESFHRAFINGSSGDLISIKLEIMGDPFWVLDSGMANYHAVPTATGSQITRDGTANYEGGEVYVYLSFVTPSDVDEAGGLYRYPVIGKQSPFSGIYRVTVCENVFSGGDFKQTLTCVRMPGQSIDFSRLDQSELTEPTREPGTLAAQIGSPLPPPTAPFALNFDKKNPRGF